MLSDSQSSSTADTIIAAAQRYIHRGWNVIPIPHRSKRCKAKGWQKCRIKLEELDRWFPASNAWNIGVLLGEPSDWLIDVDLDHLRAIELAPKYLPPTPLMFGRAGKPKSHWLYHATRPCASKQCASRSSGMLVEARSTGCQTVFPPSKHVSGEVVQWIDEQQEPADIDPEELLEAVRATTAGYTVAAAGIFNGCKHGLSPTAEYVESIGDEPEQLASTPIGQILASPPPVNMSDLWLVALERYSRRFNNQPQESQK